MDTERGPSFAGGGPPGSRGRGGRRPRRITRLVRGLALSALLAAGAVAAVILTQGSPRRPVALGRHPAVTATTATTTTTTTTVPPPTTTATTDPGLLPQTDQFPSADTSQFESEMAALWQGVVSGSVQPALPAFFPETAYEQLKTIGDPAGDYTGRLLSEYGLDVQAAHGELGADASRATLVQVIVPSANGHWVPPGVCDNGIGYFEVPNSRVVYQEDGQTRSFGIASMISWRGVWYVVHLGSVLRSGDTGVVDDPESGQGSSAPSSTC
jgi:hypothetical protein